MTRSRPTSEEDRTNVRPAAGRRLLEGIDAVLPQLMFPAEPSAATGRLADDLRTALAHTAARGDTCHVPGAADSVRLAARLLHAGQTEQARQELRRARADLLDVADGRG